MTEHTKGPWRLEGIAGTKYPDLTQWAVLAPNPDAGKKGVSYSGDEYTIVFSIEDEADARLIAAAPDLLRTVSDAAHIITYMLDGEQDKQDMRDFLEQARAVVVKACDQ